KRYGQDYEVACEGSPFAAVRTLTRLRDDDRTVALVLAAQRMAEMEGVEFLIQVHDLHPTAKRALLIQWGDRDTAEPILRAMSLGAFDYYVPKPTTSPDEQFHFLVGQFLYDWARAQGTGFKPVRIVGEHSTTRMHELRDLLSRSGILYELHEPSSPAGRELLAQAQMSEEDLPAVFVIGARPLANPSNAEIADAFGVNTSMLAHTFDVVIVGAGPAGLGAAVYAASEGLDALVVDREVFGGQAGSSSLIRNFLGFPAGISGAALATRAYEQAWLFGAKFHFMHGVIALRAGTREHTTVLSDGTELRSRAVVVATGVTYRRLGIPSLEAFRGLGVFYGAAVSEARAVEGQQVIVAGGGNSAGQAALHLANYAAHVTILVRGTTLAMGMSDYLVKEIDAAANVEVRFGTELVAGQGQGRLETLVVRDRSTGEQYRIAATALFVLIGAEPHTDWLPPGIERDDWGYVLTGPDLLRDGKPPASWPLKRQPMLLETSIPGVFAAGDVHARSVKRVASAVGAGAIVIQLLHDYLATA
ncbi:MAG TPA: FAD-dependent oxidoreductase, partial [Jiangellaceae bacterium]|nr:FAD-dependent oxidoreductase [Jiangellaceae bacterium]